MVDYLSVFVNHSDTKTKSEQNYLHDNIVLFRYPNLFNSIYLQDNLLQIKYLFIQAVVFDHSRIGQNEYYIILFLRSINTGTRKK